MQAGRRAPSHGSSPRTWGTRFTNLSAHSIMRFIPTDVGNTSNDFRTAPLHTVHPHGRGEHGHATVTASTWAGSSPRTWGTRAIECDAAGIERFIPTDVGNTAPYTARQLPKTVHPHGRGEHQVREIALVCVGGSSPRTWGTQLTTQDASRHLRFIPTDVGNTNT